MSAPFGGMKPERLREIEENAPAIEAAFAKVAPDPGDIRVVEMRTPAGWDLLQGDGNGAGYYRRGAVLVGRSVHRYDGRPWMHVSVSAFVGRSRRLPTYEEIARVKQDWFADGWAYQCFAPKSEHVNDMPYCLHLFGLLDRGAALPDFTLGLGTL